MLRHTLIFLVRLFVDNSFGDFSFGELTVSSLFMDGGVDKQRVTIFIVLLFLYLKIYYVGNDFV